MAEPLQNFVISRQSLSQSYSRIHKRRLDIEKQVNKNEAQLNHLQMKVNRMAVRLMVYSQFCNKNLQADKLRSTIKSQLMLQKEKSAERLQQLRLRNSRNRSIRDFRTKQVRSSVQSNKYSQARRHRSMLSDAFDKTITQQSQERANKWNIRQREILDGEYRVQNIASRNVQLLYLKSMDNHKKLYQQRLKRRQNLIRIKEDLQMSGLHTHNTTI